MLLCNLMKDKFCSHLDFNHLRDAEMSLQLPVFAENHLSSEANCGFDSFGRY